MSSQQRIIFVNRYFFPDLSATSQMLTDLARDLDGRGYAIHVVCCRHLHDDPAAVLPAVERVGGIQVHRVRTTRFGRAALPGRALDYASFYLAAMGTLYRLARQGDIVAAKADPPLMSIAAGWAARLRGAHLINWLQDVFPEVASGLGANPLPRWLDAMIRALRTRSLMRARTNVVLGERMREHLLRLQVPGDRVCIIENWADGDAIRPLPAHASRLRQSLGAGARFVVGYSGNLGRAHDCDTLLEAAGLLRPDADILFLMVGGGAKMRRLQSEVESSLLDNFRFLPHQRREELGDSLGCPDVHLVSLLPSMEGLIVPSKFYGILAAGRPVLFVGDPDGELARIIRSSDCGAVVSCGDGHALAAAITRLKSSPELLRESGERARRLFDERYTLRAATRKWVSVLQDTPVHDVVTTAV